MAPIAWLLVHHELPATLLLFLIAAVSDGADGFLAKHYGWQTELGAILDPLADKLLVITLMVALAYLKLLPGWLMAAAVIRDVVIVGGALAYRRWVGPVQMRPTSISKLNTLCQLALVVAVLSREIYSVPPAWCVIALGAIVLVTVTVSGLDYVLTYGRRAL